MNQVALLPENDSPIYLELNAFSWPCLFQISQFLIAQPLVKISSVCVITQRITLVPLLH